MCTTLCYLSEWSDSRMQQSAMTRHGVDTSPLLKTLWGIAQVIPMEVLTVSSRITQRTSTIIPSSSSSSTT